jgi:hypothetical protein
MPKNFKIFYFFQKILKNFSLIILIKLNKCKSDKKIIYFKMESKSYTNVSVDER